MHRRTLLAWAGAVLASQIVRAQAEPATPADIRQFAIPGQRDWTEAFRLACAASSKVYFPLGTYELRSATWPSDIEIYGDGDGSVLVMPGDAEFLLLADSGSAGNRLRNLVLHDVQLRGTCDVDGFDEYRHLVSINGVQGVRIHNVLVKGFRGDGIYIGSGTKAGQERHNSDVAIEDCRFDGINRANRNAVTVIDGDGIVIRRNSFANTTAPNMPGAVDVEPDRFPFHVVRNISITDNQFDSIGGFVGIITVSVPKEVVAAPANIVVERNTSVRYEGSGAFFYINANRLPDAKNAARDIRFARNNARGGAMPFLLTGRAIRAEDNRFSDFTQAGCIGFTEAADGAADVKFTGNELTRCGSVGGRGMIVYSAQGLYLARNRFIDCGAGEVGRAYALVFGPGRSSGIDLDGNEFSSPRGRTKVAIQRDAAHVFAASGNRFAGNRMNGLRSYLPAAVANAS